MIGRGPPLPAAPLCISSGAVRAGSGSAPAQTLGALARRHPKAVRPVAPKQKLPPPRAVQQQTAAKRARARDAAGAARPTAKLPPTPQQHQAAVQEQEE